jgi:hypothetical protein
MVLRDLKQCGQQTDISILEEHGLYIADVAEGRNMSLQNDDF